MIPVNCGSHADYQNFVITKIRKYYPDPNALSHFARDIINRLPCFTKSTAGTVLFHVPMGIPAMTHNTDAQFI